MAATPQLVRLQVFWRRSNEVECFTAFADVVPHAGSRKINMPVCPAL